MHKRLWVIGLVWLAGMGLTYAGDGDGLRGALEDDALVGDWIYDDAQAGLAAGRETGKPVLISFRCVP